MSTHHRTVKLALAIALALAGCRVDTQSAATPASTKSPTPAKVGPLSAARRDALQKYDLDGNGVLEAAERARIESERKARMESLKARLHARYDHNGNGVLEAGEVQAMQADRDKLSVFKGAALRRYDTNHNGVLDPDERQRMLGERQVFLKDVRGKLMAKFDTNRDGMMDPQERAVMDRQLAPRRGPAR